MEIIQRLATKTKQVRHYEKESSLLNGFIRYSSRSVRCSN